METQVKSSRRYLYLDALRGKTLLSMMLYHTVWDLVYMKGLNWGWFESKGAYFWQQSICWCFILLSGFCWSMGRNKAKRGGIVFGAGMLVSVVTLLFAYEQRVIFGVLTMLGTCMLLMIPFHKLLEKIPAVMGLAGSFFLFLFTKPVNSGYLGIGSVVLAAIPDSWYRKGYLMTFLGFPEATFYSTDYFSLFPWFFLFISGYFFYRTAQERNWLNLFRKRFKWNLPFEIMGKHSLIIYLLHQPIIYLAQQLF